MYIYNNHRVKCTKGVLKCIKAYYFVLSNTYYSNTPNPMITNDLMLYCINTLKSNTGNYMKNVTFFELKRKIVEK